VAANALTAITQFTGEQPIVASDGGGEAFLYGLYFRRPRPGGGDGATLEGAEPLVLSPWMKSFRLPFSSQIPSMSDMTLPVTDLVVIEITSWVHLWMANLCEIGVAFGGWLRSPVNWLWMAPRVVWGVAAALDVRAFPILISVLRRLVVRGRRCRIHPTATVEASILGNGVEVGPFCCVRGSLIGDNVRIFEQASVDGSVIGDGVLINPQALVKFSVAYPDGVLQFLQAGLLGRGACLGRFARCMDLKLQGTIKVRHRGALVDTGLPFLGPCIGHRAVIAGDTILPPGRFLPNDYKVVSDPGRQLTRVPDGMPAEDWLLVERDGTLESLQPIRRRAPKASPDPAPPVGIPSREA
jgi:hypothetical protein